MELPEILDQVRSFGCSLVEVTGGEPLAQPEALDLIRSVCDEGYEVLIETSGSIDIAPVDRRAVIVMDLKCPGSGESEKNLWSNLDLLKPADEIKLVIADRADYEWAKSMIREHHLDRWTVLLSVAWGDLDMVDLASWILEDRLPVRMQTQLHKHIWGPDVHGV